ncbi:MAG: SWIM zinc finger family protein [Pirellulales bacterium]
MDLTLEEIARLAPDAGSVAAGKKLMAAKHWHDLGFSSEALWGICRGSADYQVRIESSSTGYACSCPSRKFPCKHVLGLMMLRAASPGDVPSTTEPEWVRLWLDKRKERAEKKVEKEQVGKEPTVDKKPVDSKAKQKRAAERDSRMTSGLERFDIWMQDLVRSGLASVESKPAAFWENEAKRLVDAQAPGLASRVKRLAMIPRSTPDWPSRLLHELGRIKLLIEAWQRIDTLHIDLQWDVRQHLGWTVSQAELDESGSRLVDQWAVIGKAFEEEDRIRSRRTWLIGRSSGRLAVLWHFAPLNQTYAEAFHAGTEFHAALRFYPGAAALRAKREEHEPAERITTRLPGHEHIDAFLDHAAEVFSRSPWQSLTAGILRDVRVTPVGNEWFAVDNRGRSLAMSRRDHFPLLSFTGGEAVDLTGEWDGHEFHPLGSMSLTAANVAFKELIWTS